MECSINYLDVLGNNAQEISIDLLSIWRYIEIHVMQQTVQNAQNQMAWSNAFHVNLAKTKTLKNLKFMQEIIIARTLNMLHIERFWWVENYFCFKLLQWNFCWPNMQNILAPM